MRCLLHPFLLIIYTSLYSLTWGPVTPVSATNGQVSDPSIGIDASGNAVLMWGYSSDGTHIIIQASTYSVLSQTWSAPTTISPVGISYTEFPVACAIAVAPSGDAVAVWNGFDGSTYGVRSATYSFGSSTWSVPTTLASGTFSDQTSFVINIAGDASGNATAIWSFLNLAQAATYSGGSWGPVFTLSSGPFMQVPPTVDMSENGRIVASWCFFTGAQLSSWTVGGSPGPTINIPLPSGYGEVAASAAGIDSSGNILAVWEPYNESTSFLQSGVIHAGQTNITDIVNITDPNSDSSLEELSMNDRDEAIVVWNTNGPISSGDQTENSNWGNIIDITNTWTFPQSLSMNDYGNAVLIFGTGSGPDAPPLMQILTGGIDQNWSEPRFVSSPGIYANSPSCAINNSGDIAAAWVYNTSGSHYGVEAIMAEEPNPPPPPPPPTPAPGKPTNLSGRQSLHRFPCQGDLINTLTWSAPNTSLDYTYKVYRNHLRALIATVTQTFFQDHQIEPGTEETYFVTTVDPVTHRESRTANITIP